MYELPHQAVIHLQTTPGQFGDQTAQGKLIGAAALQQPVPPRSYQLLRPVTADLPGTDAARPAQTLHPLDRRADPHTVVGRCLSTRHLSALNRADGQRIQQRLAALGYYSGRGEGAWDNAARVALRKFKAANGLGNNENWDASAETVLFDEQAARAGGAGPSDARKTGAAAAAVPLPPKRPIPPAKAAEHAAAMAPQDALRPPGLIPVPARGAATRGSP